MYRMILASVLTGLALTASVQAQSLSLDAGYGSVEADELSLDTAMVRADFDFNPYLGLEAQAETGTSQQAIRMHGMEGDVRMSHSLSAFVVAQYPLLDRMDVFMRAGYANTRLQTDIAGHSEHEAVHAPVWGVGSRVYLTDNTGVRFDYNRYGMEDSQGFSIAYFHRFQL